MPFIPHTLSDVKAMLAQIGVNDTDSLFDEIDSNLRFDRFKVIPDGLSEMAMLKEADRFAQNTHNGICFMGAGSYDHHIPAAVWDIASRGEFLTAYTPYQAEASQGTLQLLYEFQTMMAELTDLDIANASMYDGASCLAEASLMAVRLNKKSESKRILVPSSLHPYYQDTLKTIVGAQHIEVISLPFDKTEGITSLSALKQFEGEDVTALIIPQPNFFGCLESVNELTDWAEQNNVISIACVNPISLALLKPPGQWGKHGVDIACGEGQPLGVPMASGGPYFGFICTKQQHVRQLPGRLVGRTVDKEGRTGFTLTLQAREQHIRRGKATSNICTNQGLLVTVATLYMSLLGPQGLNQVAQASHAATASLLETLSSIPGVERAFTAPFFHEIVLKFRQPVEPILKKLCKAGILGGLALDNHYPHLPNTLLVCATEKRSEEDIKQYAQSLRTCLEIKGGSTC